MCIIYIYNVNMFNTRSAIPYSDVNLMRRSAKPPSWTSVLNLEKKTYN